MSLDSGQLLASGRDIFADHRRCSPQHDSVEGLDIKWSTTIEARTTSPVVHHGHDQVARPVPVRVRRWKHILNEREPPEAPLSSTSSVWRRPDASVASQQKQQQQVGKKRAPLTGSIDPRRGARLDVVPREKENFVDEYDRTHMRGPMPVLDRLKDRVYDFGLDPISSNKRAPLIGTKGSSSPSRTESLSPSCDYDWTRGFDFTTARPASAAVIKAGGSVHHRARSTCSDELGPGTYSAEKPSASSPNTFFPRANPPSCLLTKDAGMHNSRGPWRDVEAAWGGEGRLAVHRKERRTEAHPVG